MMNLVLSSLNAQTSLTTRIAQYDIKVDDSVTYRTGQNVIRPYNIGNRYKDLSAIVKGLVDTVRAGGGGGATDTTSLSNRINERIKYSDTTNRIATIKTLADTMRRDSLQTVITRGNNSNKGIRFGSSADVVSLTIDSSGVVTKPTVTNYARFNSTGLITFTSNARYDYSYNGFTRFDLTTGYNTRVYIPITTTSDKTVTVQDKSGTFALLSDFTDTIANRVATKSDTVWGTSSLRLATESDLNARMATITDTIANRVLVKTDTTSLVGTKANLNTKVTIGGNTVGGTMVYGIIDSFNRVEQNYNVYDTVYPVGRHTYNGKTSEAVMVLYNNNNTTGVRQTNSIVLGIGTGGIGSSNTAFIGFGAPASSTTKRFSTDGIIGYSVLDMYSTTTAGTIIHPAFQGANTGDCISVSLGSYTGASNTPIAGNLNIFKIGTGYQSTGRFAPTSGTANLRGVQGAIYINASGTYSGTIKAFTDDSMTLVGLASGTYIGYEANQNSGWGFRQNGASAKNSFVGRTTFGTTTDNGTDAVQVVGDVNLTTAGNKLKIATGSNASIGTGTLGAGGTVTISTTAVTASSRIFLTGTAPHTLYVSATVAGTSFTVTSSNSSDNSTFNWLIIN